MQIADRVSLWGGKKSPLPPGARWVEYLESTGRQYIDTGWKPTSSNLSVEAVLVDSTGANYNKSYFGSEWASTATARYLFVLYVYNTLRCYAGNTNITNFMSVPTQGQMFDIKWDLTSSGFTVTDRVSGTTVTRTFSGTIDFTAFANTLKIFQNTDAQRASMKLYSFKIWDNGVLVRDYISVRKGTVGAIYDRRGVGGMNPDGSPRNDGMYFNRGTGAFAVGPDAPAMTGGGYKRLCVKRSHRRSSRPSARFWHAAHLPRTWKEVA